MPFATQREDGMSLTLLSSEQKWILHLNSNPMDWTTRLIYADWLDDAGRELDAATQRWMAEHRKSPRYGTAHYITRYPEATWDWWNFGQERSLVSNSAEVCAQLTEDVFARLYPSVHEGPEKAPRSYREYHTRRGAEVDLKRALRKLGLIG